MRWTTVFGSSLGLGLGLAVAFAAGPSSGSSGQQPGNPPWAVAVPALEKLRADSDPKGASSIQLSLARGECEGVQLLTSTGVKRATVEPGPLAGPKKARLLPRAHRVGFIPVKTPSNSEGASGHYGDALLPLEATKARATSPRQAFYLELCAHADQPPGSYRGVVRVLAQGRAPVELPFHAEVQPFTIPATSSLPNSFGLSLYSIARGHGLDAGSDGARELMNAYVRQLLEHRLSAHGMSMQPPAVSVSSSGQLDIDFTAYDREVGPFLEGKALPNGAKLTSAELRLPKALKTHDQKVAYARALRRHFAEKGWEALLFYYAKDEPKPGDYPEVIAQARVMREGGVPVLITSPDDETLTPAADILSPTLNCFFSRRGPQTCKAVRPLPELRARVRGRVWWYQSCNSHGCTGGPAEQADIEGAYRGWASYMVDHPAPLNRAMGPLAFLSGVDGELYFDTVFAYNTKPDVWQDVFEFGGNGDGTLFYPGTPAALGTARHLPIPSIRLKHIRDGLEDYEYLRLLRALGEGRAADTLVRRWVRAGDEVTRNPREWMAVRSELTRRLRQAWERRNNGSHGPSGKKAGP